MQKSLCHKQKSVENNFRFKQVSTWFANARRRLKKENKMTWSPRNRVGEDDDDDDELDDVNLNENPANRLSPLTPDLVPNTHVTTQAMDRSYNDHGGGIENSNEVFNFAKKDNSRSVVKNTKLDTHESGRSPHTGNISVFENWLL